MRNLWTGAAARECGWGGGEGTRGPFAAPKRRGAAQGAL